VQILPQHNKAIVPIEKLRDYALNPNHPQGKDKARVFKATLGMERDHADTLREILISTLVRSPAVRGLNDQHGERWITYHEIIGLGGKPVVVTSAWIYRVEQADVPVLIPCYIEPQGPRKRGEALNVG
jgi:hypothetical protein